VPTLSEAESKRLLSEVGLVLAKERQVGSAAQAAAAAISIGFPVVAKLCGDKIAHKTERGLVRLNLTSEADVERAAQSLFDAATPSDGEVSVLIAEMVQGRRELIAGVVRDPAFGPCVMLGVGGIFSEAIEDVVFRVAPLDRVDADEMINNLASQKLLGAFRGEPAVDRNSLAATLLGLSKFVMAHDEVVSVDCNPLIIVNGVPVAVDARIEVN
jgi:acetate---CoA ligase (ADP-forming) subunit beta